MRKFKLKKQYGNYKTLTCSFCGRTATQQTEQGVEVCHKHTHEKVEEIKCTCGSWLELKNGKFGPYFNCINCGNLNYQKGMEMKEITGKKEVPQKTVEHRKEPQKSKEITISTNDPQYFD
jgi:topoisomerase IA-like protein